MASITHSVIARSLIGKTFWKSLALQSFLYGANLFYITEEDLKKLKIIENGVFRKILGAPKYAGTCAFRGEMGSSMMKVTVIKAHVQYARSTLQWNNQIIKEVMETQKKKSTKWVTMIATKLELAKLTVSNL